MNYDELIRFISYFLDKIFISYAFLLIFSYTILSLVSGFSLNYYLKKNSFVDYSVILDSPLAPSVSVLVPAFNEAKTIVDNVESIYTIHYNNFDVIIINDGSTDSTFQELKKAFQLEQVNFAVNMEIPTQEVRGVYKSSLPTYPNLIVVDKVNGGKADALNAGINVSGKALFMAIDADSILEPDAVLKLVKPFLERTDRRVIAAGGVVRIANSCMVEKGRISEVRVPKNLLARMQVLEYTRSFLMGRIAWAKLDGLIIISGAMGMFDRDIVIQSGGYAHTIGEDMELVVRIRRFMSESREKYKIEYVPDPLCWTEAPVSIGDFGRQRSRWTRGTIETLTDHSRIFFSTRYGAMGMLGYPFWFIFEWLAPLVELLGIIYVLVLYFTNNLSLNFILVTFVFVYTFALFFSTAAILYEEITFHRYERKMDVFRLWIAAVFEPFLLHPLNLFFAVKGNIEYLMGNRKWGKMERKGFLHRQSK
ncbi:glycosyltransferase family 2 protein [Ancylomarina longa]|uniref:Glycosyltransferase family 2 protein n=1 Tax=Ancylomarina longa TaxID=2487017 RepID=A0A434AZQ7_9BACT|nr:glycosyltransferase [Ancylomarina longa]RUT80112.1 glycosyltransferase family 2 protein [Ancylomarina longa]